MKKNYSYFIGVLLFTALFAGGCKKETKETVLTSPETALQSSKVKPKNECRLVSAGAIDPAAGLVFTFNYNDEGLVHEWNIANYGLFTQEYDDDGRLEKSIHSVNGEVIFTIHLFYKENEKKVQKEILYLGSGTEVIDVALYTYNAQGNIIKVESTISDYLALTEYTPEGNISSDKLFLNGSIVYSVSYTYDKPHKNPFSAVPGIDHAFPFFQGALFFNSKWQFSGVKEVGYDENGDPIVIIEYDSAKTVWNVGHQNYTLSATYFNLISNSYWPIAYEYENCGPGANSHNSRKTSASSVTLKRINPSLLFKRDPSKTFKQQVQEFRQELKK